MSGALDGLRVIDFGQYLAAPMAAMILCDNGAEVIRIDPPGGPRWKHPANAILQRGKRSIVLDLKKAEDVQVARDLIAGADVVLEGFRPGVMARLGLGPAEMTADNSELIYCSIPGFGHDDPRATLAGWEGIVGAAAALHAKGGNALIASSGATAAAPIFNPVPIASNYAAVIATSSIIAALIARHRCGRGQIIEVPLFDAVFEGVGVLAQKLPPEIPNSVVHGALDGVYQCADGLWIYICMPTPEFWTRLSQRLMDKDWFARGLDDPHLLAREPAKAQEAIRYLAAMFRTRPAVEWDRLAGDASLNFTICKTTAEWLGSEQGHASGAAVEVRDDEYGVTQQTGFTHRLDKTPASVASARHRLDADADAIRDELAAHNQRHRQRAPLGDGPVAAPLAGLKVIDTSHYLAGPTCGRLLAEYGADVIKVDAPARPIVGFLLTNSGKRSALIDLKTSAGLDLLNRHLADADVLVQSFSPGTVEKLGIDEDSVRVINPEIIFTSINCYGATGPRANLHGVEAVAQSITGMAWRWGGTIPKMQRLLVSDYGAGHLAALGTLVALYHRVLTGQGQRVQTSLVQAATFHQTAFAIDYADRKWDEPSGSEARGWGPLDRLYEASDGWFYLVASGDAGRWAMNGIEGLQAVEGIDGEALVERLTARFATERMATWQARIAGTEIALHPVEDFQAAIDSDVARSRGLVVWRNHGGLGAVRSIGAIPRLSLTPVRTTAPISVPPGSDTADVVREAGLGGAYENMILDGVVAERPTEGTFLWL